MDLASIAGLVPLGGASVLLIALLNLWLTERRTWERERRSLYDLWARERQTLIDVHRRDVADRQKDYDAHIAELRAQMVDRRRRVEGDDPT